MSFKVNTLGAKVIRAERVLDAEMVAINLAMIIILAALIVSLNNALLGLMSIGYFATALTAFASMIASAIEVVITLLD